MIGTDITQRTISFGLHRASIHSRSRARGRGFFFSIYRYNKNAGGKESERREERLGPEVCRRKRNYNNYKLPANYKFPSIIIIHDYKLSAIWKRQLSLESSLKKKKRKMFRRNNRIYEKKYLVD